MNPVSYNLIDLTHLLDDKTSLYPGTLPPKYELLYNVEKDGFAEHRLTFVLHTGTHIDAPAHMLKDGKTIDKFPVNKFIGKALVINCIGRQKMDLDFLKSFENKIKTLDFILFYTGWQEKWSTGSYASNCPELTNEAAKWLAHFNLKGIGIDAFSLDRISSAEKVTSEDFPNHHTFLSREILLIENLTNLDKLPQHEFVFQCLPLNIEEADGSPIRAVALIED